MTGKRKKRGMTCFVPACQSSRIKTPDKIFIHVPMKAKSQWCEIVGLPKVPSYNIYCCEDHFNLKEDILHYEVFSLAGGRKRIKPGVVPRFNLEGTTRKYFNKTASTSTSNEVPTTSSSNSEILLSQSMKQEKLDDETQAASSENYNYEMLCSGSCKEENMENEEDWTLSEYFEEKPHFEEILISETYKIADDELESSNLNKSTQTDDTFLDSLNMTSRTVQCEKREVATQTFIQQNSISVSAEFDDINKIFK